jgi:ketosteroid isomerase-like protein
MAASAGAALGLAGRALLVRLALAKFRADVRALNTGDYRPVLSSYAEDAVLYFNEGSHRWSGEHRGKPAIERFLRDFLDAGLQGQVEELFIAGAPWRMTLAVRFDDRARDGSGEEIYANRTVLLIRTRWGRIVRHEDFYEDTQRIVDLEARIREREAQSQA